MCMLCSNPEEPFCPTCLSQADHKAAIEVDLDTLETEELPADSGQPCKS